LQQGLHNASTIRAAAQTQAAAAYQQQVSAWGAQQDKIFERELPTRHPHLAADKAKMHKAAEKYLLKTTGLTKQQITQEWNNGRWRSAAEQMILADAISHEMARESARDLNSKKAPVPPVQMPGTFRPRGAADMDQVRDLEDQLEGAKGQKALQLAMRLTQAKRATGALRTD
jgi:hypothetical protein